MHAKEVSSILLVDDDAKVLKAVKAILEAEGYPLEACHDPLAALQAFKVGNYDLVLSDIKMPEMSGIELLSKIREQDPDVPVILHTGYAELSSAVEAVKKEAFDYLLKPVEPEMLIKAVERGLQFRHYRMLEKNYQQRLKEEVQAATVDLFRMVEELKEARDQALEASRLKSEFIGNMSHELRTPLNQIIGLSEVMLDQPEMLADHRNYLQTIVKAAWGLNGTLNNVLELSQLDSGQVDLSEQDFQLDELLTVIRQHYQAEARERGLELTVVRMPGVPAQLRGDSARLEQVLQLLLDNAFKFTEQGSIAVKVERENGNDHGNGGVLRLRVLVSDTGCGIPAEKQECIFASFRQADGSLTRCHGGAGLGLAVAKRLVKLLGGEISVTSEPGKGSTFIFSVQLQPTASGK
ncbi:response regulator [Desulfurivibrio alkaliphilus]|uniref:histidine kinase n=1 Tax=Desulfurivibrio alkaliphilus (strain DSM 19089 / UNIQEM U267 / AHT2) TaxID=589865 RepID=D6Z1A3_DESAT|nr:response regulator [Desulfurivibrio alkaliphilus]ADH85358.1 response regulator receiver sensor signal transduction histidine kinase [Desulfurivibrio alkaliphilus AHT 2]